MSHQEAPRTCIQAMDIKDRQLWEKTILVELDNMKCYEGFAVTELPVGAKAKGCTWVFKEKWAPEGEFFKHKASLCAQSFTQLKGFDYDETYAPTGSKASL